LQNNLIKLIPPIFNKPYNWYVDSVLGNDSNSGKSKTLALLTIAGLMFKDLGPNP